MANALSLCTAHVGRVSWYRTTCATPYLLYLPVELWRSVLGYLPASQTVPLVPLMQRHRYYSAADYRFHVAVGDRGEERKEEQEVEREAGEERGEEEWQVVQGVSLDYLYDVAPLPPGVEAGRLRLHPQALLMMR